MPIVWDEPKIAWDKPKTPQIKWDKPKIEWDKSTTKKPSRGLLAKEEEIMANLLSIPTYAISPGLREYVKKYRKGEVPQPKTVAELGEIAFGGPKVTKVYAPAAGRTALELGGFYKPSRLLIAKGIGKGLGLLGKGVAKITPEPIKKVIGKAFKYRYGQPSTYQYAAEKATLKKAFGVEEAKQVSKVLSTTKAGKPLSRTQQQYVGRLFRGEVQPGTKLAAHPKFQEYQAIAKEGRQIMDKWSSALAKSGVPSEHSKAVIEQNIGRYMPRMFEERMAGKGVGFAQRPLRLKLAGLKHRKDLSESVLKKLKEIKEPALPTAIRVRETATTVANAELFNTVAKNPEWAASSNLTGKMIQMPKTPNMGGLSGKWVIPEIAEDINGIIAVKSQALRVYDKALSAWKFGKVVLNPATHSRNIMSNTMLLDMSGVNHFRQAQLFPRVIRDYATKGKMYQEAKASGLLGTEFYSAEASQFLNSYNVASGGHLAKIMETIKTPLRTAGNIYQMEEQVGKMIKFTDMRMKGFPIEKASAEAERWLFNYNKIPKFIEFVRRFGSPFVTFSYKALPRLAETAVNNPLKLYKYYAFANAFNNASARTIGLTEKEVAREKKYMPEWMKTKIPGMPTQLLMPTKDQYGRTQYLNLEYILPIGMAPEVAERGLMKGLMTNPALTAFSELKGNRDFRGKEIYSEADNFKTRNLKIAEYLYRQVMPSFAPGLPGIKGGYSWEKVKASLEKRGDYLGRVREPEQVLLDVFAGLKIQPVSVKEGIRFQAYKTKQAIADEKRKVKKAFRHKGISKEEKKRVLEEGQKNIRRIQQQQLQR